MTRPGAHGTPATPRGRTSAPDDARRRAREARDAAARATGLLGVDGGERLHRIARQAAQATGTGIGMISLIDGDRMWIPGRHGTDVEEIPVERSACMAVITTGEPYVIEDAPNDPSWADNPIVAGPPYVRFYAGCPVPDADGNVAAVICVLDGEPREHDPALLQTLEDMAPWVSLELFGAANEPVEEETPQPRPEPEPEPVPRPAPAPAVPTDPVGEAVAARLAELERLQALIVSTTAHELRSPLTVLRAHAELLAMRRDELAPHERSSVDAIVRAAAQLQEVSDGLVAQLRDAAGGAEGSLRRWLGMTDSAGRGIESRGDQPAGGRYR